MHVVVTGGTGFLGRAVCDHLTAQGHTLAILSRSPRHGPSQSPMARFFAWNALVQPAPGEALEGADAVVNLLGEPVPGYWTAAKKRSIRDSRVEGTRNLVAGIRAAAQRPFVLVSASAIGYYGDRAEEELPETASPGADFLGVLCQEWEAQAQSAAQLGVRVVCLRIGIVLGKAGGALGAMLPAFRLGAGGPLGSGRQWWSWVHRDDLVAMIMAAISDPAWTGAINATAPQPVRQGEFARELGRVLGRPSFLPAPAFALRALLGGFSCELLSSKKVVCTRARALGFEFRHPQLADALRASL